jgi:hypothetical protein
MLLPLVFWQTFPNPFFHTESTFPRVLQIQYVTVQINYCDFANILLSGVMTYGSWQGILYYFVHYVIGTLGVQLCYFYVLCISRVLGVRMRLTDELGILG